MCWSPDEETVTEEPKKKGRKRAEIEVREAYSHENATFVDVRHPNHYDGDETYFLIPDRDIPRLIKALNRRIEKLAKKAAKKASKS